MIFVQNLLGQGKVQTVFRFLFPGKLHHPVKIRTDNRRFCHHWRHRVETVYFLQHDLFDFLIQFHLADFFAQFFYFRVFIVFIPQLFMNRFDFFTEIVFFLLLVVAALTSTISLHEVITAYLHEEWHMSRRAAAWSTTGACMALAAVALVCAGVIGLGVVESREDDELRRARQAASNYRYAKSWLALALPVAYCLLDAAGTFADSLVLRSLDPDSANCAYELTFLFAAVVSFVYVKLIRHDRFQTKREAPKYIGALFETAGQFAYIYAIADEDHVMYAAPIIAAYCAASVLWSRVFLREKLSWRHYMMLVLIVAGIVLLGILDI